MERTKNIGLDTVVLGVVLLLLVTALCWFLFSDHRADRDNIGAGFQQVDDQLGRVRDGIDRSEEGTERLAGSIDRSESIIGELSNDLDRSAGEIGNALAGIRDTESRIDNATAGIERAESGIQDGLRRAGESKSIFARYESGNRGERSSPP